MEIGLLFTEFEFDIWQYYWFKFNRMADNEQVNGAYIHDNIYYSK